MPYTAHPTAIVDEGSEIGDGTRIWHWVHVCAGARIGRNCSLGQNVFVGNDVVIGDNVRIQNNVSVYDAVVLEDRFQDQVAIMFFGLFLRGFFHLLWRRQVVRSDTL